MARQTRKYSRLKNFIQEVKFIYNIQNAFNFLKYIQDIYLLFKIFKTHEKKNLEYMGKKILEYNINKIS